MADFERCAVCHGCITGGVCILAPDYHEPQRWPPRAGQRVITADGGKWTIKSVRAMARGKHKLVMIGVTKAFTTEAETKPLAGWPDGWILEDDDA